MSAKFEKWADPFGHFMKGFTYLNLCVKFCFKSIAYSCQELYISRGIRYIFQ